MGHLILWTASVYKITLTKPSLGSSGKVTSLIIPLVGQASCQGVSRALGHLARQGWARRQSSEAREEKPFLEQQEQRGSRRAVRISQKQQLEKYNRSYSLSLTARGVLRATRHQPRGNRGSWLLGAGSPVRMLQLESCLHFS